MRLVVRSWNVFHGRTIPPGRTARLEAAVRLAVRDGPAIVCLQEVPVWGLRRLARWSGMAAVTGTTVRAGLGPLPLPVWVTRRLTDIHHGRLRALLAGQGNAILVSPKLRVVETGSVVLNDRSLRRAAGRRLRLGVRTRIRWAFERRIAQAARIDTGGRSIVVVNVHASHLGKQGDVADVELERAASFAETWSRRDEVVVLAGDFNVLPGSSKTLRRLAAAGWTRPGPGIDHVVVRGAAASPLRVWPDEERRRDRRLLSDHAPVELAIDLD